MFHSALCFSVPGVYFMARQPIFASKASKDAKFSKRLHLHQHGQQAAMRTLSWTQCRITYGS